MTEADGQRSAVGGLKLEALHLLESPVPAVREGVPPRHLPLVAPEFVPPLGLEALTLERRELALDRSERFNDALTSVSR